ncbi:prolipoprotein diacylglyceryl transferase [Coprobacter secundus]|uniref:Phosphatidylglycerol--prolipoprotein diacylglyceryl transferase n=1 Tax=Coprobacter secundus subsp. similis TaxID=2751153 RepID=A0A7G1I2S1_9BACT|nr:prolipoprotein diacylglyceryl transferase [Coprobacter secundus]BCI64648.1 prolipoprotein diacylglyceryl transferase [Coprobacter secundus subsp. similis]
MLDFITWTADPAIFSIFSREIRWYGLFFAIGFLIGYQIEDKIFKHDKAPEGWVDKIFIYTIIATVIGARLGHCLFYGWDYYSQHPIEILKIWEGGLASHGGAIGIIIAILIYSKKVTHKNPLWAFDRLVIPTALVGALIRMGNLMNHEIYGHPTHLPWGFRFIENITAWRQGMEPIFSAPSHPTQIYEALCYFIIFLLLMYMYWKKNAGQRQGLIFGVFLVGVFFSRFCIEFLKNNQEEFEENMILNMGQLLSIPFVIFGIYLIIRALKQPIDTGAIIYKKH